MGAVPQKTTYQVFINHSGTDAKKNLAELLYYRLAQHGLDVFLRTKTIRPGENVPAATARAISSASIRIVLFSERYAESRSCLDELCFILKSSLKRTIIPVFADVEPADLRSIESGCYARAFRKHEVKFPMEKMDEWKEALREAAYISGFLFKRTEKKTETDYEWFVEDIVNIVIQVFKSKSLQPETYQVFLSHRGPDAKLTHASLIYHHLKQYGLRVFMDLKEFRTGDGLSPAIERAIHSASVHVVIFSKTFAESSWCLNELNLILKSVHECSATIVPIFYDVEPFHLRDITRGPYAEGFKKHKLKGTDTTEWEKSLKRAADISGVMLKTDQSDYGIYLEHIVRTVFKAVKERELLEVATHPVGLVEAAKDFENIIGDRKILKDTKIVGIAGMGGLGKSTLAKHLYNVKRFQFKRSSILLNVRGRDLPSLQEQLIRDLLMDHDLHIDDCIQGKGILQRSLRALQALIVLDDVDNVEQINSLLDLDAVGSGSLILLTSRDKDLLRRSSPKVVLYDVKPLNIQHAQNLFFRHAFSSLPDEEFEKQVGDFLKDQEFEKLVGDFVKNCGGSPLSLKIFGRHIAANKDKNYWKLQLETFSGRLPDDIINSLKLSYEALRREEKEMFLDIGCFLVGEDRELAVRVLEELGYSDVRNCLESLRQKCLVEFDYAVESNNYINKYELSRVIMHDQVKGLARHIAREDFFDLAKHKPLRLSCLSDIKKMFQLQAGSKYCLTRGIRIPKDENPPKLRNHMNIRGIRLLVVDHPMDLSSFTMSGPLIWLRLNNLPSISIPTISLVSLIVLEFRSPNFDDLQQLFKNDLQQLFKTFFEGSHVFNNGASGDASASASSSGEPFEVEINMNIRNYISTAQKGALKVASAFPQLFPIDLKELQDLRHLDLSGCTSLTELPHSFPELLQLQYLALQYCINLSIPVGILGEISTLEYVNFRGCAKLEQLPEGMKNQSSLKYLNLEYCFELKTLPDLSHKGLRHLDLSGCTSLTELPRSFSELFRLQYLALQYCINLSIPVGILGDISTLEYVNFRGCAKLEQLPQGMKNQSSLKYLNLEYCFKLKTLPDLSHKGLRHLDLSGCASLTELPHSFSDLLQLQYLALQYCINLSIPVDILGEISTLEYINFKGCAKLKQLPEGIKNQSSLKYLNVEFCSELKPLPDLSHLPFLKIDR